MVRLINADALKEFIASAYRPLCDDYHMKDYVLNQILTDIKNEPTVDAEPVRHGKWIKADSQQYFQKRYPLFTCSVCGYRKDGLKKWNYCPNCGADMRESE